MKIGIYSGTFDPVHNGHTDFAEEVMAVFDLDILYMIAEPIPRRKTNVTELEHRKRMLQLATAYNPKIKTTLNGLKDSHDVDGTLNAIESIKDVEQVVMLMGIDVFLNIDSWKGYEKLLSSIKFALALRTEDDGEEFMSYKTTLPPFEAKLFSTSSATISSSKIRRAVFNGSSINGANSDVIDYIEKHELYRNTPV